MIALLSRQDENTEFSLVGLANALPIAGYFLLEWSFTAVAVLFWLEVVAVILFYGGLAMFATPERRVGERETLRRRARFVPPVYPENLRAIVPKTVLGLLIASAAGGSLTVWGTGRGPTDGSVMDFFAQFPVFESPSVFAIGLVIVGTHIVTLWRYYVGTGRYRELTPSMALEVQMKYSVIYLSVLTVVVLYTVATFVIIGVTLDGVVSDSTGLLMWEVVVAGSFLAVKLAFEWCRFRGERQPELDDGSFTANFSPTPRTTEDTT